MAAIDAGAAPPKPVGADDWADGTGDAPSCPADPRAALDWLQRQFDSGFNSCPEAGDSPFFLPYLPPDLEVTEPLDLLTARLLGGRQRRHLAALSFYPSEQWVSEIERGLHYVDQQEADRLSLFCSHPVRVGYQHPPVELTVASQPWHVGSALASIGVGVGDAFSTAGVSRAEAERFLRFRGPLSQRSALALTLLLDRRRPTGPHFNAGAERLRRARRDGQVDPARMADHFHLTLAAYLGLETGEWTVEGVTSGRSQRQVAGPSATSADPEADPDFPAWLASLSS